MRPSPCISLSAGARPVSCFAAPPSVLTAPPLPQMGGKLQSRADSVLLSIDEELKALTQSQSQSQSQVELTLDTGAVEHAIKHMSFMQMKRKRLGRG